jgi:hypothetical protein
LNTQLHKDSSGSPEAAAAQDKWLEQEVEREISSSSSSMYQKNNEKEEAQAKDEDNNTKEARTIALSHIPPFINDSNEEDGYFNIDRPIRRKLLNTLRRGGCTHWFCGHYHRNAGGIDRGEIPSSSSTSSSTSFAAEEKHEGKVNEKEEEEEEEAKEVLCGNETPLEVIVSSAIGCVLLPNGQDPLGLKGFVIPPVLTEETSGLRVATVHESGVSHQWYTLVDLTKPENALPYINNNDDDDTKTDEKNICDTSKNPLHHASKKQDDDDDEEDEDEPAPKRRTKH